MEATPQLNGQGRPCFATQQQRERQRSDRQEDQFNPPVASVRLIAGSIRGRLLGEPGLPEGCTPHRARKWKSSRKIASAAWQGKNRLGLRKKPEPQVNSPQSDDSRRIQTGGDCRFIGCRGEGDSSTESDVYCFETRVYQNNTA